MDDPATLADHQRAVLRAAFYDSYVLGHIRPLLLPWCFVPSFVVPALYLALPHAGAGAGPRALRAARVPLAVAIAAANACLLPLPLPNWVPTSSGNMAAAYGAGVLAVWGTAWAWTVLVWTNAQQDAERVERRFCVHQSDRTGPGSVDSPDQKDLVPAPDTTIAHSLAAGYAYYWQAFPDDAPWSTRFGWALDLCLAWRGTGWNVRTALPRFGPPTHPRTAEAVRLDSLALDTPAGFCRYRTHASFFVARLLACTAGYLVLDVLAWAMTLDPYFVLGPPPDRWRPWSEQVTAVVAAQVQTPPLALPPPHLLVLPPALAAVYRHPLLLVAYRGTLGLVGVTAAISLYFSLHQIVCMMLFRGSARAELWHYPSLFGRLDRVLDQGLAGFWGSVWHQTFRVAFVAPMAWLVRTGLLPRPNPGGWTRAVGLTLAFGLSGLLHAAGSLTGAGRAQAFWWSQMAFFGLAAVGIALQTGLAAVCRTLGLGRSRAVRRAGNLAFTLVWMLATQHYFVDDLCRNGIWLFEPVPFSLVRWWLYSGTPAGQRWGRWAGQAAWRWYDSDMLRWHVGAHWWDTGLAIS